MYASRLPTGPRSARVVGVDAVASAILMVTSLPLPGSKGPGVPEV